MFCRQFYCMLPYPTCSEKLPWGTIADRLGFPFFRMKGKNGRLLLADLPQDLNGLPHGYRRCLNDNGRLVSYELPGISNQFRPGHSQPEIFYQNWSQKSPYTDADIKEDKCGEERIEKRKVANDDRCQGKNHSRKQPHEQPLSR